MSTPTIKLGDVLTEEQISDLFLSFTRERNLNQGKNTHAVLVNALTPIMSQIDTITGQENDVDFWAYLIEHAFTQ